MCQLHYGTRSLFFWFNPMYSGLLFNNKMYDTPFSYKMLPLEHACSIYINIFCENKKRMSLSTWKYQFSCDHWSQATSGSARWQHTYFEWFFKSVGCKWFMPNGLNHDFQLKNISETISGRTILISMILTFSSFKEFQHFQILTFSDSDTFRICHKMTSNAWIFFYFNMHWILL